MALRPPPGDESVPELVAIIADEIRVGGSMSFARFMELAVAHPVYGYYAASTERVGTGGDFLTAPETHPLFGWLLARQVAQCWSLIGRDQALAIREYGGGAGTLGYQIFDELARIAPDALNGIRYEIEEVNPDHRELDTPGGTPNRLIVSTGLQLEGVVIANEYFDALPFHRLVKRDGELREIYVELVDGWFAPVEDDLTISASRISIDSEQLVEGQIIEYSPASADALKTIADQLSRGFVFVIDYGYEEPEIFAADRFPTGSLKTYRQHTVGVDPFLHIGMQDITAHVNLTGLLTAAEQSGLAVEGKTSLAAFCASLGLDQILLDLQRSASTAESYVSARTAALAMLDPSGLGRFRVLALSKAVRPDEPLSGFTFMMSGY